MLVGHLQLVKELAVCHMHLDGDGEESHCKVVFATDLKTPPGWRL